MAALRCACTLFLLASAVSADQLRGTSLLQTKFDLGSALNDGVKAVGDFFSSAMKGDGEAAKGLQLLAQQIKQAGINEAKNAVHKLTDVKPLSHAVLDIAKKKVQNDDGSIMEVDMDKFDKLVDEKLGVENKKIQHEFDVALDQMSEADLAKVPETFGVIGETMTQLAKAPDTRIDQYTAKLNFLENQETSEEEQPAKKQIKPLEKDSPKEKAKREKTEKPTAEEKLAKMIETHKESKTENLSKKMDKKKAEKAEKAELIKKKADARKAEKAEKLATKKQAREAEKAQKLAKKLETKNKIIDAPAKKE